MLFNGNAFSHCDPSRVAALSEFSYFASNPNGQSAVGKFRSKVDILEVSNDRNSRNTTRRISLLTMIMQSFL